MPGFLHAIKNKRTVLIGVLLLSVTAVSWGNTAYIFAKAKLAQYLIADAWKQTLLNGENNKPWTWADTWPVARLLSEEHQQDLYILAGASGTSLAFGPGHLDGSALPEETGSMVVGGHRDTHFDFLKSLKSGETLQLQDRRGRWHKFEVLDAFVSDSRREKLVQSQDLKELILVTCYPFDALIPGGPLRYVVTTRHIAEANI